MTWMLTSIPTWHPHHLDYQFGLNIIIVLIYIKISDYILVIVYLFILFIGNDKQKCVETGERNLVNREKKWKTI